MPVITMARPLRVGGLDHFLVAHRAAGLDHGRGAGLGGREQAVGEREERVGGDHRALDLEAGQLGLDDGDARGVHPAHLAGADADGGADRAHRRWRST